MQVFTRARRGRVTQRCHNSLDEKRGYKVRMTSRTASAWRILWILKKDELKEERWISFARRGLGQVSHEMVVVGWMAVDGKARIERMCIFKLKGNKKFRTWTKKPKVFSSFRILMFYVIYIYIYIYIVGYVSARVCVRIVVSRLYNMWMKVYMPHPPWIVGNYLRWNTLLFSWTEQLLWNSRGISVHAFEFS